MADWGAIAQGAAGAGGLLGDIFNGYQSHKWAAAANQHAMAFTRWMDNTKYTRTVRDLRNAGLNPALAYVQGAHTQGAPSMQIGAPPDADIAAGIGSIGGSARAQGRFKSELDSLRSRAAVEREHVLQAKEGTKQAIWQTSREADISEQVKHAVISEANRSALLGRQALQSTAETDQIRAYTGRLGLENEVTKLQAELMRAQVPSARVSAEFDKSWAGEKLIQLDKILKPISGGLLGGAVGGFIGGRGGRRSSSQVEDEYGSSTPNRRGKRRSGRW